MSEIETAVYFDDNYHTIWIEPNHSSAIARHFQRKSVRILDANELRVFVRNSIIERVAHRKIIVFSQDVVPDTICEHPGSDTLIREYLDAGGNIIWIGDIPLFYIGIEGVKDTAQLIQAWRYGGPVYTLGTLPVFSSTMQSANLKWLGRALGLHHHWTSMRPVLKDTTVTPLATTRNIGSDYYINVPKAPGKIDTLWRKLRRLKSVDVAGFGVAITPPQEMEPLIRMYPLQPERGRQEYRKSTLYETHIAAWIKNYNEDFPYCGLARIWDYRPREMPNWMIEELYGFTQGLTNRVNGIRRRWKP